MSHSIIDQVFTKNRVAIVVSKALRKSHRRDSSAVKEISRKTGVNSLTVSNWYRSVNAPNAEHLVSLMMIYPEVFLAVMGLVNETNNILIEREVGGKITSMSSREMRLGNGKDSGDMNVTLKTDQHEMCGENFNNRQRWFLIMLSSGTNPNSAKISEHWRVSRRTAKRDIAKMVKRKIIVFRGARNSGRYVFSS